MSDSLSKTLIEIGVRAGNDFRKEFGREPTTKEVEKLSKDIMRQVEIARVMLK